MGDYRVVEMGSNNPTFILEKSIKSMIVFFFEVIAHRPHFHKLSLRTLRGVQQNRLPVIRLELRCVIGFIKVEL